MLITLSMYRNINVEATKIVDITPESRVNNYNRKLLGPATSAACIIPNNALGFSNYLFLSHGQQLQQVHSYSHLIVEDLDKAYFLPYHRSSHCKGSRLYNDNKYMHFDYAKKDTKESDLSVIV